MKSRIFALLATLILTFAFSVTCMAAPSPNQTAAPTQEETSGGSQGGKTEVPDDKSPKTGADVAGAFIAVISAAGIALVSKKKFSEAN